MDDISSSQHYTTLSLLNQPVTSLPNNPTITISPMNSPRVLLPLFILFCININVTTSQCLLSEQSLLLQLKENLVFNLARSKRLVHWNQSGDCCKWNGVACNKEHVIGLDLSEEFISGGLDNSSLFNLQSLQNLNLAHNSFGSSIPSKFDKLKSLRYLNLSNAGFVGQIPLEISQLINLATLDLSTSFSSLHPLKLEKPNIAKFLHNLTEIRELYLDGVKISAEGKEWSQALSPLRKLQVLSMSSCNLSGPIHSSLVLLQDLSTIRLNLNDISSPVPEFFSKFSNLKVMELRSCKLNGSFPNGIFQMQTLEVVDVSDNHDLHGCFPNLMQDVSLQTLNLSNTNFFGQLPGTISNLKQLSTLDLSNGHFNGSLPSSISEATQLVHVDLSFNNFTGPVPSFKISKNLRYLSLSHNNFTGSIQSTHLEGLANLITINLGDNSLNGEVPSSLFTLPSLQELTLSRNGFDGPLEEFPNASSSQIQLVDLSSNKLEGPIPVSIFQLKRLRFLLLSENEFNGTIWLDMIQNLQGLHTLGLSNNKLQVDITSNDDHDLSSFPILKYVFLGSCKLREFPNFFRNQHQLIALDLGNNLIQGTLPNWILRIDTLVFLNLSNNLLTRFEGPLQNLSSNLYVLDLHSNKFLGSIPTFTRYAVHLDFSSNFFNILPPNMDKFFPFLNVLSLSNNNIQGKIDDSFCNFSALRLLDLSHNSFNGFIPMCLTRRNSTLRVVNLAGNKLTGNISDAISSSCDLRFLDLNGNLLTGSIPKSLANCQRLQVLNLGNNLLSDAFPCFLSNISTLRVLILRSNKLHGPIGCQHSTMGNWDMLHIVDLAYNNFTGAVPGSLLQSWTKMMDDENEAHEKYGDLFSDIFDGSDTVHLGDLSLRLSKFLATKLIRIFLAEPYFMVDMILAYYLSTNEYGVHYLDSVTVVVKGLQINLVKIPTIFTTLDLSCNHLKGPLPEELMNLRALNALNLSHNSFSGHIPSSLGNLMRVESLDMSYNTLSGEIPQEISSLSFLSVLNLSFNHLAGKIPTGTQIQSFEEYTFEGNDGLCGPPLSKSCGDNNEVQEGLLAPAPPSSETRSSIDWKFLSVELGFTFGFGLVILPLLLWKRWRLWYSKHVDDLLHKIFPQLEFFYEQRGSQRYRTLRWRPRPRPS